MNLTPTSWKRSEVEERISEVKAGTKLIYSDCCNFNEWTVLNIDGVDIHIVDEEGFEDYIDASGLQIGWRFARTTEQ